MTAHILKVVRKLNVTHPVARHLFGREHHAGHRMIVGSIVMVVGVLIAKCAGGVHIFAFEVCIDLVGYGIHGLGLTPFIEHLLEKVVTE